MLRLPGFVQLHRPEVHKQDNCMPWSANDWFHRICSFQRFPASWYQAREFLDAGAAVTGRWRIVEAGRCDFQRGIVGVVMVRPGTSLQVFSKWSRCYITKGGTSSIVHFLLLCLFFHLRFLHLVLHIPTPPEDGCAKESWQCLHHRFWPCQTLPESTHQPAHSVSEWSCFGTLHFRNVAFCSKWWYRKLRLPLI